MAELKEESYYSQTLVKLIAKYKLYNGQCLDIVGQTIDTDIKDDKLVNVLKAKRQAAEDAKWTATEIDSLEAELRGETIEDKKSNKPIRYAEKMAD